MYATELSSHKTGICDITSAGEISPAIITKPFHLFLMISQLL